MLVFPFGDDNVKGGYFPLFTYIFLAINVLVFLYEIQLSEPALASFFHNFGTVPAEITEGHDTHTLLTNMFLHGGWAHLISCSLSIDFKREIHKLNNKLNFHFDFFGNDFINHLHRFYYCKVKNLTDFLPKCFC